MYRLCIGYVYRLHIGYTYRLYIIGDEAPPGAVPVLALDPENGLGTPRRCPCPRLRSREWARHPRRCPCPRLRSRKRALHPDPSCSIFGVVPMRALLVASIFGFASGSGYARSRSRTWIRIRIWIPYPETERDPGPDSDSDVIRIQIWIKIRILDPGKCFRDFCAYLGNYWANLDRI